MNDLLKFIDELHTDKELPFSRNLVCGIEITGIFRPHCTLDDTGSHQESQEDMPAADMEEAEFDYGGADVVAVMAGGELNVEKTFWLARIVQLHSASSGTRRLKVHWYDIFRMPKGQQDVRPLKAKYKKGVDIVNGRQKPKTDSTSMKTVLTVFPILLNTVYIPMNAQMAIYTSLANARE